MKGIKCCGECAYYNMKNHKCTGGAKDAGSAKDSFYADCPHDEAEPVRHGRFVFQKGDNKETCDGWICTNCKYGFHTEVPYFEVFKYCPMCGARMDAGEDQGGADE